MSVRPAGLMVKQSMPNTLEAGQADVNLSVAVFFASAK
jgi:hypothetical protein